jgi:hypothetical protein
MVIESVSEPPGPETGEMLTEALPVTSVVLSGLERVARLLATEKKVAIWAESNGVSVPVGHGTGLVVGADFGAGRGVFQGIDHPVLASTERVELLHPAAIDVHLGSATGQTLEFGRNHGVVIATGREERDGADGQEAFQCEDSGGIHFE